MSGGEKCPRCHYKDGYPLAQTISRGKKMRFVCRHCHHTWIKRGSFSLLRWKTYGGGLFIGVIIGLYQLVKIGFLESISKVPKELFNSFTGFITSTAKSIAAFLGAIFQNISDRIGSPILFGFLILVISVVFIYVAVKIFQRKKR